MNRNSNPEPKGLCPKRKAYRAQGFCAGFTSGVRDSNPSRKIRVDSGDGSFIPLDRTPKALKVCHRAVSHKESAVQSSKAASGAECRLKGSTADPRHQHFQGGGLGFRGSGVEELRGSGVGGFRSLGVHSGFRAGVLDGFRVDGPLMCCSGSQK